MEVIDKKAKHLLEDRIFTVSNFLSILRVILLPPFIYYSSEYVKDPTETSLSIPLLICFLAILTDYLDGFIARLLKQETVLGRYLDPVCDKIVTIGGLCVIVAYFHFPEWILIVYIIREILGVWLGTFLYFKRGIQGKPNWWGKFGVGIVSMAVIWYMSLPLIYSKFTSDHILKHPEYSGYVLLVILLIGIYAYCRRYWTIVFYPEKYDIDQDKKQKKKYHVI
ncbi:MAG: CDP-alcohol phosphatidyltransferase family protein [Leptospira sp.]|nr:CDP-alcohol phosphatidyltransferase family protein [Leptospira sp.]